METLGKMKYTLMAAAVILVLMILKASENRIWKGKPEEVTEKVISGSCFLKTTDLTSATGMTTLLRLNNALSDSTTLSLRLPQKEISFTELVRKETIKELKSLNGRLVIIGRTPAEGMKAWVMLHQLGVEKVYVLNDRPGSEVLKYRFRPDSLFRPEPEPAEN